MYKTQLGIKLMDRMSKRAPRFWKFLSVCGVFVGFLGMGFLLYFLSKETLKLILVAGTEPALAPVLPGIAIAGAPALSFWHWILAIFVAAVIHEFAHGLIARLHNIPIKSSGFAFLGPLLAAFVEPDEKVLEKKSMMQQLAVFAAGPFSNILLGAFVLLLLIFVVAPAFGVIYQGDGIIVHQVMDDYPMNASGIAVPFTILAVNGEETLDTEQFVVAVQAIEPGDEVTFTTDKGEYLVVPVSHPDNASAAFFGVAGLEQKMVLKEGYSSLEVFTGFFDWIKLLILWVFLISVGVGLFNLLPLGPVDGGRMFYALVLGITKKEAFAKKALIAASIFCLALIVINMIPWLNKLLVWIAGLFSLLIALV
ncbi:MAG: site-2 protease family protein [bacterium]|nr:site-2 protease family protein [bacterium]